MLAPCRLRAYAAYAAFRHTLIMIVFCYFSLIYIIADDAADFRLFTLHAIR